MARIEVRCPLCSKWNHIEIADNATDNVSKGLLAINIATGMICEHSFIAYVDKNLIVRDCLVADFKIELPEGDGIEGSEELIKPETETIKFDLIKLNIPDTLMTYAFRAMFLGKKALILLDQEFLFNHILNFFKYISQNSFDFELKIMSEMDYRENKIEFEDYLIIRNRKVIKDDDKIINPKELEVEQSIVQKFFNEYDLMAGLIILRNEINKAFEYSNSIITFIDDHKEKTITSKLLINHISEKFDEKIGMPYLTFLLDIVRHYFKVDVPKIGGVSDLLGLL
ncbi:MAG: hypothetical protein ACFE9S_02295 [Candidatus Hermodarchaeota archaeon]